MTDFMKVQPVGRAHASLQSKEKLKNTKKSNKTENTKKLIKNRKKIVIMKVQPVGRVTQGNCKLTGLSNKQRNKICKCYNGNGKIRQNLTVIHWNMGSRGWINKKEEIELVILQHHPDIYIITEANMKGTLSEEERDIPGYYQVLPRTIEARSLVRIVMLVKEGVEVETLKNLMTDDVASIWVKVGTKGRRPITIGAMYREHRYLEQGPDSDSETDLRQLQRWNNFIEMWRKAARRMDVMVMGDLNLDYLKWTAPTGLHAKMIDRVKIDIETEGFFQVVEGFTRSWNNQPDTLIDHCWLNVPAKVIYHRNLVRASSDHNMILVSLRTKDRVEDNHDIIKRQRKNWDPALYKEEVRKIEWSELYKSKDIDFINNFIVTKLTNILDVMAPIKTFQKRKNFKNWIDDDLKLEMGNRDRLREIARISGRSEDWDTYRLARNKCTKQVLKSRNEYYQGLYTRLEEEKDTRSIYRLTAELLNEKNGALPQKFLVNGKLVRKPSEMANLQLSPLQQQAGEIDK